jgi:MerR family transcriptional regulator, light-induced transcriptional regulator
MRDTLDRFLSPKQFAQAVGVSESSVKRWADEGLLEVTRTAGGHRRLTLREAARYIRKAGLPMVRPELLGISGRSDAAPADRLLADHALTQEIVAGRAQAARSLAMSLYLSGCEVADLCDGPLTLAMRQVGELWRHGPEGIFIEHRASAVCAQCLHQLRSIQPSVPEDAPTAVGGGLEGDPYMLPTLMVAVVLEAAGWHAVNLGPNLPMAALLAAVKEHQPSLVWLSCSQGQAAADHARDIRRALQELSRQGIPIIAGGRGWNFRELQAQDRLTTASSMAELVAYTQGRAAASAS